MFRFLKSCWRGHSWLSYAPLQGVVTSADLMVTSESQIGAWCGTRSSESSMLGQQRGRFLKCLSDTTFVGGRDVGDGSRQVLISSRLGRWAQSHRPRATARHRARLKSPRRSAARCVACGGVRRHRRQRRRAAPAVCGAVRRVVRVGASPGGAGEAGRTAWWRGAFGARWLAGYKFIKHRYLKSENGSTI